MYQKVTKDSQQKLKVKEREMKVFPKKKIKR
jgi:hypothetical protein